MKIISVLSVMPFIVFSMDMPVPPEYQCVVAHVQANSCAIKMSELQDQLEAVAGKMAALNKQEMLSEQEKKTLEMLAFQENLYKEQIIQLQKNIDAQSSSSAPDLEQMISQTQARGDAALQGAALYKDENGLYHEWINPTEGSRGNQTRSTKNRSCRCLVQ